MSEGPGMMRVVLQNIKTEDWGYSAMLLCMSLLFLYCNVIACVNIVG